MVGPKLDARTYTTLVLTVIAVLLTLNLVTAQSGKQTLYTDAAANADIAAAVREVADANLKIAESNGRIADSIDNLARAVGKVKLEVNTGDSDSSSPAAASTEEGSAAAPSTDGDVIFDLN